jgi:hypothetical protein
MKTLLRRGRVFEGFARGGYAWLERTAFGIEQRFGGPKRR